MTGLPSQPGCLNAFLLLHIKDEQKHIYPYISRMVQAKYKSETKSLKLKLI